LILFSFERLQFLPKKLEGTIQGSEVYILEGTPVEAYTEFIDCDIFYSRKKGIKDVSFIDSKIYVEHTIIIDGIVNISNTTIIYNSNLSSYGNCSVNVMPGGTLKFQ
jgi:hypothetical protein